MQQGSNEFLLSLVGSGQISNISDQPAFIRKTGVILKHQSE
jgi:hypothetical protein